MSDILEQGDWYAAQAGEKLAVRWEKAVTAALSLILIRPTAGARCTFTPSELQDLRRTRVSGFPKHLIFYRFDDAEIFVVRVIHGARDLERLFS